MHNDIMPKFNSTDGYHHTQVVSEFVNTKPKQSLNNWLLCRKKLSYPQSANISVKWNRNYFIFSKVPQVVNLFVQELSNIGTMCTGSFDVFVKN